MAISSYIKSIKPNQGTIEYGFQAYYPLTFKNGSKTIATYDGSSAVNISADTFGLGHAMHFRGIATATTSTTYTLSGGTQTTAIAGDVIIINESVKDKDNNVIADKTTTVEYVFDGSKWVSLGDESSYAKHGTYNITASGTVKTNVSTKSVTFKVGTVTSTGSFRPSGAITSSFSGQPQTITVSGASAVTNSKSTTATSTGSVSFSTSSSEVNITSSKLSATITAPKATVTLGTTSINSLSNTGTASSFSSAVENNCLVLTFTPNVLPGTASINVATSVSGSVGTSSCVADVTLGGSATVSNWTGGTVSMSSVNLNHSHTIAATAVSATCSYTPTGVIGSTFSGNAVSSTLSINQGTITSNFNNPSIDV